jgi:hypothetical protein
MTPVDVLRAACDYARDPDHIVTDPTNIYESESGAICDHWSSATRGCILGINSIASRGADAGILPDPDGFVSRALRMLYPDGRDLFTLVTSRGTPSMLAVYEKAIELAEAKA